MLRFTVSHVRTVNEFGVVCLTAWLSLLAAVFTLSESDRSKCSTFAAISWLSMGDGIARPIDQPSVSTLTSSSSLRV